MPRWVHADDHGRRIATPHRDQRVDAARQHESPNLHEILETESATAPDENLRGTLGREVLRCAKHAGYILVAGDAPELGLRRPVHGRRVPELPIGLVRVGPVGRQQRFVVDAHDILLALALARRPGPWARVSVGGNFGGALIIETQFTLVVDRRHRRR